MTQEDKELLLKDLCGRLSNWKWNDCVRFKEGGVLFGIKGTTVAIQSGSNGDIISEYDVEDIHPYLRPMSSMTHEEIVEINSMGFAYWTTMINNDLRAWGLMSLLDAIITHHKMAKLIDWLNKKMFDYRKDDEGKTMIEKGLALEAPEGMYNIKEK